MRRKAGTNSHVTFLRVRVTDTQEIRRWKDHPDHSLAVNDMMPLLHPSFHSSLAWFRMGNCLSSLSLSTPALLFLLLLLMTKKRRMSFSTKKRFLRRTRKDMHDNKRKCNRLSYWTLTTIRMRYRLEEGSQRMDIESSTTRWTTPGQAVSNSRKRKDQDYSLYLLCMFCCQEKASEKTNDMKDSVYTTTTTTTTTGRLRRRKTQANIERNTQKLKRQNGRVIDGHSCPINWWWFIYTIKQEGRKRKVRHWMWQESSNFVQWHSEK